MGCLKSLAGTIFLDLMDLLKKTCKNESHGDGKNRSDVEDLDLIVNVTEGQRTLENGLSPAFIG